MTLIDLTLIYISFIIGCVYPLLLVYSFQLMEAI